MNLALGRFHECANSYLLGKILSFVTETGQTSLFVLVTSATLGISICFVTMVTRRKEANLHGKYTNSNPSPLSKSFCLDYDFTLKVPFDLWTLIVHTEKHLIDKSYLRTAEVKGSFPSIGKGKENFTCPTITTQFRPVMATIATLSMQQSSKVVHSSHQQDMQNNPIQMRRSSMKQNSEGT